MMVYLIELGRFFIFFGGFLRAAMVSMGIGVIMPSMFFSAID
jgi:hypothetical protein